MGSLETAFFCCLSLMLLLLLLFSADTASNIYILMVDWCADSKVYYPNTTTFNSSALKYNQQIFTTRTKETFRYLVGQTIIAGVCLVM